MARVTVRVSDLSGKPIPDEEPVTRLIVEHPEYPEPIGLDVLPGDVLSALTDANAAFVIVSLEDPENPNPQRHVLSINDFEELFATGDSRHVLQDAYEAQQQERDTGTRRRGRGRRAEHSGITPVRQRVDYTSPEHAGEPHRGTISEAEKAYIRDHLEEVNARLREQGKREINPNDPAMARRYGFDSTTL